MSPRQDHRRPRHPELAGALGLVNDALGVLAGAQLVEGGDAQRRLHVGCSGGADSAAALLLLELASHRRGLELSVGYVDHGLRSESASEGDRVQALAQRLGLPFARTQLELGAGPGLPARARDARRAALWGQANEAGAPLLVLGHTATDQLETLLMHLTRGAGLDGLSGMPVFDGRVLRPVLGLTREQSKRVCEHFGYRAVEDPTNERREHYRVQLRHEVLPLMRAQNPDLEGAVLGASRLVRDADEAIFAWVQRELGARRSVNTGAEAGPNYSLHDYAQLPRAIRTGFVRSVCVEAGVASSELRRRVVESIDRALMGDLRAGAGVAPRQWDLPGGYVAQVARSRIWARKP